ncbi:MAG: hypothetical protein DRP78_00835 [Candidatus Omnitrophota bacterium]|nr:MAG: hypothetical protein DRP78_00835 [Candidatus Omnitrophota bacterium]
MIDKALEDKIMRLKEFVSLWESFYTLFKDAINKKSFQEKEEQNFLELKSNIARKYQSLMDSLGIKPTAEDRTFDVISQIMSLKNMVNLSPLQLEKVENDWHNSYITFNKILGTLDNKKIELGKVNAFSEFCKNFFTNSFLTLFFIIAAISLIYYFIKVFSS